MSFSSTRALVGATAETQHFHHFGGSDRSQASAATGCQIDRLTIFPQKPLGYAMWNCSGTEPPARAARKRLNSYDCFSNARYLGGR